MSRPHTSRPAARLVATAALVATAVALVATPSAGAAPRSFFGVVPQTPLTTEDLDRMGQGRVGTLRIILNWSLVDPTSAPADYNWSSVDPIVADAARNGIVVLPFVFGTPKWVAEELDGRACGSNCELFAPRSAAALDAWATFLGEAVARYGPNGQFWVENPTIPQVPIEDWQVWNEQNSPSFFKPKPSVRSYAKLLDSGAAAIRAANPDAEVVLGGMAELAGAKGAIRATRYLEKLYDRKGARKDFDGVAPHPYGAKLRGVTGQIDEFREVIKDARDRGARMWVTELGWGSKSGGNPLNVGKQGQAQRLKQAFRYFKRKRGRLNVETVTWFSWMDSPVKICEWCGKSGLFGAGLTEKPAWRAFVKFTGGS